MHAKISELTVSCSGHFIPLVMCLLTDAPSTDAFESGHRGVSHFDQSDVDAVSRGSVSTQ